MIEWFTFFVDCIGDMVSWCAGWYLFGTVSFLDFIIVLAVSAMLINVFVARGSAN